ncbi:MAG TPA: serine protease [Solirubrobacterales bacterium]|nr:serine protease [Solirubrobacterales bacterium]
MTAWGHLRGRALSLALACIAIGALALPTAAPAEPTAQASIVGGHAGSIAEFPFLSFIEARQGEHGFACTGSVVAPRVVLTAAHCADDLDHGGLTPAQDYALATGVTGPGEAKPENVFRVSEVHVFPGFDPGTLHGDAAILILDRPTTAPVLALAGAGDSALYTGGAIVQLAGWGLMGPHAKEEPEGLRTTSMVVQSPSTCKAKTHGYFSPFSPAAQMCTLDLPSKKSGGCFGDSGGPTIAHRPDGTLVELGIISTGGENCSTKRPNVMTRADFVSTWVSEWIAATESGGPRPVLAPGTPLPQMTRSGGELFAISTLRDHFGKRIEQAKRIAGSCRRASRSRFKCEIAWIAGNFVYGGTVSPFYLRRDDAVVWDSHFKIRFGVLKCLQDRSRHCPIQSKSG